MNELMNNRGDCRTAPATPSLLITFCFPWPVLKIIALCEEVCNLQKQGKLGAQIICLVKFKSINQYIHYVYEPDFEFSLGSALVIKLVCVQHVNCSAALFCRDLLQCN